MRCALLTILILEKPFKLQIRCYIITFNGKIILRVKREEKKREGTSLHHRLI